MARVVSLSTGTWRSWNRPRRNTSDADSLAGLHLVNRIGRFRNWLASSHLAGDRAVKCEPIDRNAEPSSFTPPYRSHGNRHN